MQSKCLLQMTGICKSFPGVKALDQVDFSIKKGEIHALLGENGAGKSTLMKVLSGVYKKDAGEIFIDGNSVEIHGPREAQKMGIGIIHQELNLVPELTVMENIFLGREPQKLFGFVDKDKMRKESFEILKRLGTEIQPDDIISDLSIGMQQMVEIAKALSYETRILIMDEPTAALTERESEHLFKIVRQLAASGVGIIYISHRMEELFALSDRITVMRDGAYAGTVVTKETQFDDLIKLMVGRELTERYPRKTTDIGNEVLNVKGLCRGDSLRDISFSVKTGEIVGVAGLMGAGRTELARAIFGIDPLDKGTISVDKAEQRIRSCQDAIQAGIGLITEDRKHQGLVLPMSVGDNISLAVLGELSKGSFISGKRRMELIHKQIDDLKIKTPSEAQIVRNLSGGNQQKVVIAKWLSTKPRVLIMDEPTRGVDIGAKVEIYNIMNMLAASGVAILMISSELPEVLGMSDRILVMCRGRVATELAREEATQEKIMAYAAGGN